MPYFAGHAPALQATATITSAHHPNRRVKRGWEKSVLLLVVVFAVELPLSEVTAGGERLLTHGALQTLLVPRRVVDPHQEAVGDGALASFTHGRMVTLAA